MNILIINQHSNNFGDDAAGCALLQILFKNLNIDRVDILYNATKKIPFVSEKVFHHLDISFGTVGKVALLKYYVFDRPLNRKSKNSLINDWMRIIHDADYVLMSPCGANIGIYKSWASLFRILMCLIEGKKIIFYYNTIGSSGNAFFDFLARIALKKSIIYVREEKSKTYLDSIGIKSEFGPDTAFALKNNKTLPKRKNVLSLVPSNLDSWHPEFKNCPVDKKIQSVIIPLIAKFAKQNNLVIEILPHKGTESERIYNEIIKEKIEGCGYKDVTIRTNVLTMWDYDAAIASSSFVVGMRYHSVVLSAKNGVPFISLCYENKMKEVCRYTGMQSYAIDLHKLDDPAEILRFENALQEVLDDEEIISNHLRDVASKLKLQCSLPAKNIMKDMQL